MIMERISNRNRLDCEGVQDDAPMHGVREVFATCNYYCSIAIQH